MDKNIIAETLLHCNKSAIMQLSQGNYEKALQFFRESYAIEDELLFGREKAQTLVNIANTELLLKEPEKALRSSQEAAILFEGLKCRQDYLRTLLLMGIIQIFLKNSKKATQILDDVIRKADMDDIKGEAYLNLHTIYLAEENKYKAQDSITKAIQFFERSKKKDRLKLALEKRAEFFRGLKRNDLAAMDLNKMKSLDDEMKS